LPGRDRAIHLIISDIYHKLHIEISGTDLKYEVDRHQILWRVQSGDRSGKTYPGI
jgi:hypothetical protein